ncbi:MAG: ArgE/DapE family deacylase [Nanoarchaeota archaeon]|nr:ArgE/DapE family deacylase [Nanoarchaeota archaeon]
MNVIENPVNLAKKLISIPSITGEESKVANYIFDYLRSIGLKPEFQKIAKNRNNIIVKGKDNLLITGHMDTVSFGGKWNYDPLGELTKTKLYGRGTCDTKGSIACILSALAKNPNKNISLSFTVDEEENFMGINSLMKLRNNKLKNIKYCIDLEPTGLRIVTAHKGQIRFNVSAKGKAAHSSVPQKGDNAILKLTNVIPRIKSYSKKLNSKKHQLVGNPTTNIGVISGGSSYSTVPNYAEMLVDRRVIPGEDVKKVVTEFRRMLRPVKTSTTQQHKPVDLNQNSPIIKQMQSIIKKHKINPKPIGVKFTTQFSIMAYNKIQGFVFGVGNVNQAHKIDEYVFLKDVIKCHNIFSELVSTI